MNNEEFSKASIEYDMTELEREHPDLYNEMVKRNLTLDGAEREMYSKHLDEGGKITFSRKDVINYMYKC